MGGSIMGGGEIPSPVQGVSQYEVAHHLAELPFQSEAETKWHGWIKEGLTTLPSDSAANSVMALQHLVGSLYLHSLPDNPTRHQILEELDERILDVKDLVATTDDAASLSWAIFTEISYAHESTFDGVKRPKVAPPLPFMESRPSGSQILQFEYAFARNLRDRFSTRGEIANILADEYREALNESDNRCRAARLRLVCQLLDSSDPVERLDGFIEGRAPLLGLVKVLQMKEAMRYADIPTSDLIPRVDALVKVEGDRRAADIVHRRATIIEETLGHTEAEIGDNLRASLDGMTMEDLYECMNIVANNLVRPTFPKSLSRSGERQINFQSGM